MATIAEQQSQRIVFVPPAPPLTPKATGTRRRILDVAGQLFVASGYHAVSLRDIAAAAHLTKGAIYGHFTSKGQLLVEVIRWWIAESDRQIDYESISGNMEQAVELFHLAGGREIRVLLVDAAAVARHDPHVEAGLADLYLEREERIAAAMPSHADPVIGAWMVSVISAGIGMKESMGLPAPEPSRIDSALMALFRGLKSS
jgi:AcrR family transcriptional regulator